MYTPTEKIKVILKSESRTLIWNQIQNNHMSQNEFCMPKATGTGLYFLGVVIALE